MPTKISSEATLRAAVEKAKREALIEHVVANPSLTLAELVSLGGDLVLSGRLAAGIASRGTPYYERFTLGGIYSVRGFRELSLSSTEGDDGGWIACCELRFPLIPSVGAPPRLSGLAFFRTACGGAISVLASRGTARPCGRRGRWLPAGGCSCWGRRPRRR